MKFLVSALVFFILLSASCNKPKMPDYIGMDNLKLSNVNFNSAKLSVNLKYHNPNNFGLDVKDIDLNVFLDGKNLGKAIVENKQIIPNNSDFTLPISLKINPSDILQFALGNLSKLKSNNEFEVTAKGKMKVGKQGVFIPVPVNFSEKMKLPIPGID